MRPPRALSVATNETRSCQARSLSPIATGIPRACASRAGATRAWSSSGIKTIPSTPRTTKSSTTWICAVRSSSLSGPFQITSTASARAARSAPACTDFQNSCVVPLGITAMRRALERSWPQVAKSVQPTISASARSARPMVRCKRPAMAGKARPKVPWRGMRIDAHQHFWRYAPEAYGWIGSSMSALQRDFLPADLQPLLALGGIDACVAVQARQCLAETTWLLELAGEHPWIAGVVGWADLCAEDAAVRIEELARDPKLVGLRHVAQDEPDDFLLREDFGRGLGHLARHDLAYDILIRARQLPAAIELARRFPAQTFVLDHLGKPAVSRREREPWTSELRALAAQRNVSCKLSGLVTEADWKRWQPRELSPYLNTAVEV